MTCRLLFVHLLVVIIVRGRWEAPGKIAVDYSVLQTARGAK